MKQLFFLFLILHSLPSFALKATTGVQVCGKKVTLYAFYEGAHPKLHNFKMWKETPGVTREAYVNRALDRLRESSVDLSRPLGKNIIEIYQQLDEALVDELPTTESPDDVVFVDPGCEFRPASLWRDDTGRLEIDRKIFRRLSPMGQAGLLFLEAHFKLMRKVKMGDPDEARRQVARFFSDERLGLAPIDPSLPPEQKKLLSLHACTLNMNHLGKITDILVKIVNLCKKGVDDQTRALYQSTQNKIEAGVSKCLEECHWDEGRKTCTDYRSLLNRTSVCD